jgi:hypothetical protein
MRILVCETSYLLAQSGRQRAVSQWPHTLFAYLTKPNPPLELQDLRHDAPQENGQSRKSGQSYTRSEDYPTPSNIEKWEEFNLTNIKKIFNGDVKNTLKTKFFELRDFSFVDPECCQIVNEKSLEVVLYQSTERIVLEALRKTSWGMISQNVYMLSGDTARLPFDKAIVKSKSDWAGKSTVQRANNILPGDTKVSKSWTSDELFKKIKLQGRGKRQLKDTSPLMWPIRQILHYCIKAHTRYGYIITDHELVVMRVGLAEADNPNASFGELRDAVTDNALVQLAAIPWGNHTNDREMTINLALWIIHLLAANNGMLDRQYGKLEDETAQDPASQKELVAPAIPASLTTAESQSQQPEDTSSAVANLSFSTIPHDGSAIFESFVYPESSLLQPFSELETSEIPRVQKRNRSPLPQAPKNKRSKMAKRRL